MRVTNFQRHTFLEETCLKIWMKAAVSKPNEWRPIVAAPLPSPRTQGNGILMKTTLCLLLTLVFCATFTLGQSSTGTVQGSVKDASGALIPDATVTITNSSTGRVVELHTNGDGLFSQPALDP